MNRLLELSRMNTRLAVGLMSGTSVDGVDAALVRIQGIGAETQVELIAFDTYPFSEGIRSRIFELFDPKNASVEKICHMNFLLGEIFADSALQIIESAGYKPQDIALIGSHGQTIYHIPIPAEDNGYSIRSTLQIGEPAVIAERTGIVTVGDFRVRDVAAGGQGAPIVPYTEYLLYRDNEKNIALQNIGGISNVTVLPAACGIRDVFAFDNGPGNMIMDEVVKRITNGANTYDKDGAMAGKGTVRKALLDFLMQDEYFKLPLPKTTGREYFGSAYVDRLMSKAVALGLSAYAAAGNDLVATVTALTARSIAESYQDYIFPKHKLDKVILGGGGSYNHTLLSMIRKYLDGTEVVTQETLGFRSDAKEAVAMAILANEAIHGRANNIPNVTGARRPVVMGKIIL